MKKLDPDTISETDDPAIPNAGDRPDNTGLGLVSRNVALDDPPPGFVTLIAAEAPEIDGSVNDSVVIFPNVVATVSPFTATCEAGTNPRPRIVMRCPVWLANAEEGSSASITGIGFAT